MNLLNKFFILSFALSTTVFAETISCPDNVFFNNGELFYQNGQKIESSWQESRLSAPTDHYWVDLHPKAVDMYDIKPDGIKGFNRPSAPELAL